jgi:hypothetical protein
MKDFLADFISLCFVSLRSGFVSVFLLVRLAVWLGGCVAVCFATASVTTTRRTEISDTDDDEGAVTSTDTLDYLSRFYIVTPAKQKMYQKVFAAANAKADGFLGESEVFTYMCVSRARALSLSLSNSARV